MREAEQTVRRPAVVLADLEANQVLELAAAENEESVKALATDAVDPTLDVV